MNLAKSLKRSLFVFLVSSIVLFPALAFAAEEAAAAASGGWQVDAAKYLGAALAMSVSALGAAHAQAKIGAAAAGTLAENPDAGTMLIVLQALPEIIVLLGFVSALIISG